MLIRSTSESRGHWLLLELFDRERLKVVYSRAMKPYRSFSPRCRERIRFARSKAEEEEGSR